MSFHFSRAILLGIALFLSLGSATSAGKDAPPSIAMAAAVERVSDYIKTGMKVIVAERFRPFDVSGLAVEIGTIRAFGGNMRDATVGLWQLAAASPV